MTDNVVTMPRNHPPVAVLLEHLLSEALAGSLRRVVVATQDADGALGVAYPSDMDPLTVPGMLAVAGQCAVDVVLEGVEE